MPTVEDMTPVERNPVVVIVGAVVGLLQAILFLVAMVVGMDPEIQAAVFGIITAGAAVALALFTQARFTTPWVPGIDNTPEHTAALMTANSDLERRVGVLGNLATRAGHRVDDPPSP